MYSTSDLRNEIQAVIKNADERGLATLQPKWLTQQILNNHQDVSGEDAPFYSITARLAVYDAVREAMNAYKIKPAGQTDDQMKLPGFEHLQRRYYVTVNNEQLAIRIQDLTDEQRADKVRELRAMGHGCFQHADELERFDASTIAAA